MRKALKPEIHTWILRLFVCGACNFVLLSPAVMARRINFALEVPHILLETGIAVVALVFAVPILIKGTIWFRLLALPFLVLPMLTLLASFHFFTFIF